jgi:FtsZ-binding cell division protein ZapB
MKEVIRIMADHDFRKNEHKITLAVNTIWDKQLIPLEIKRTREEEKISKIPQEEDNNRENLTATYWG